MYTQNLKYGEQYLYVALTSTIEDNWNFLQQIQLYYYQKWDDKDYHVPTIPKTLNPHNNPPPFYWVD